MEVDKQDYTPPVGAISGYQSTAIDANRKQTNDQDMNYEGRGSFDEEDETEPNVNGFFSDLKTSAACSVRVALRVRPLIGRELYESPNLCIQCIPEDNQLIIGKDRAFTFDKVFDINTRQQDVFECCVRNLVLGCFKGFNATVLAYGQTGSGKTHTMGSGYTIGLSDQDLGIIPRVIKLIFEEVEKRKRKSEFIIKCTFLEIYNEELHDLLDHGNFNPSNPGSAAVIDRFIQKKEITIREEKSGSISVFGLREEKVNCYEELAACLDRGSNFRSTASTLMNNCSSRSHAIFTISIEQHIIEDLYKPTDSAAAQREATADEFMVAKFHFVDLAGSERAKRTGATGATLKEGISINKGLLALGNVISALTEEGKKGHVPYRDSKLTRILQDSLGGNSRTSMIACVSPAEINFEETLNTLKYASRARNIKNKPVVNRDPNSAQLAQLRQQVYDLSRELIGCRKLLISNNIEFEQSAVIPNDLAGGDHYGANHEGGHGKNYILGAQEIQKYEEEIKDLKIERSKKEKLVQQFKVQAETYKEQLSQTQVELFQVQKERDLSRFQLEQVIQVLKNRNLLDDVMNEINGFNNGNKPDGMEIDEGGNRDKLDVFFGTSGPCILEEYQVKVEEQKKELQDKIQTLKTLQKDYEMLFEQSQQDTKQLEFKEKEIERLKRSVNKLQKENVQIRSEQRKGSKQFNGVAQQQVQPQVPAYTQRKSSFIGKVTQVSSLKKKPNQPLTDASNNQWLPSELDYNIKHFNELFIENLSQSLSTVLLNKKLNPSFLGTNTSVIQEEEEKDTSMIGADHQQFFDSNARKRLETDNDHDLVLHASDSDQNSGSSSDEGPEREEEVQVQDQQLVIESHEETKKQDEEMKQNIQQQEQQIVSLDGNLKDKEQLLDAIKESHKMLQNNLLEAMKMEYHKKIQALDSELKQLERERGESMRKADTAQQKSKLDETYKKKMKDLEDKLKDLRQKDKEQNQMIKEAQKQKQKIQGLESEIDKIKNQKVQLMKKMKEESEKHRKWKADRAKELMQMKQSNLKKDREISKLKRDIKRKEMLSKRKQEELSALQKKSKIDKQKQVNADKDRQKRKNIDISKIQEWIIGNTDKMLKFKELQQALINENAACKEVEDQIAEEQSQLAALSVRYEKLEFKKSQLDDSDDEQIYEINEEQEQLDLEMKAIKDNIESLEEKLDFIELKKSSINSELISLSPDDIEKLNFSQVQSIEGARACLGAFFGILLDVNVQKKQLENQALQYEANIDSLRTQIEELTMIQKANEFNFQKEIEEINKEYREKEDVLMKIIMENGNIDLEALINANSDIHGKSSNNILKEYLKNKENEVADSQNTSTSAPQGQNTNPPGKKINNQKQEIKKQKEQSYHQSKTALSKRVAELERKNRDEEKKLENLRHKYEQSNQEKELYKRQLETVKQKLKTQEVQDVKLQKALSTEDAQFTLHALSKSPRQPHHQPNAAQASKLLTLQEMRKERKIKKLGSQPVSQQPPVKQGQINEPKVIADEPMEEEFSSPDRNDLNSTRRITISNDTNNTHLFAPNNNNQKPNPNLEPDQVNVFARLSQGHKRGTITNNSLNTSAQHNTSQIIQQPVAAESFRETNGFVDDNKWKCIINKENAHNHQICALASVGNQLYSTSNKSLKIWDLDTMTCVSDIQAHTGFIKCMAIWEDKKLLITASEKIIMLWDLISLTNVGSLKGHKDEIKAMNVSLDGNLLFSAGKGSANGGALLLWDLRKGASPCEEKEKNQDIFSLTSTKDYLFYGCRSHQVYPFNIKTFETLPPFEPPHFDAVTSLAILDNTLISGSRDKNLRCWDYSNISNKYSDVMQAHSDWINTLETDYEKRELYSGGKDGVVKVWRIKNKKLKCMASLSSNSGSINSLCKIDRQFGKMFALGSSDKSIRMWKFKDKYLNQASPIDNQEQDEEGEDNEQAVQDLGIENVDMVENQEIEQYLIQQLDKKEEQKQHSQVVDNNTYKYQPVRQAQAATSNPSSLAGASATTKLQQMRRQKRLQDNQKRQQKENDLFQ